jgi:hypothetical protein
MERLTLGNVRHWKNLPDSTEIKIVVGVGGIPVEVVGILVDAIPDPEGVSHGGAAMVVILYGKGSNILGN